MKNIKEDIINGLKQLLLTEDRESKNMSKARKLLYQQGYSQEDAQKTIEAIRNDIPNARLADCKFLPGVTRMYINRQLSDGNTIMKLNKTLKYVASDAHINEYDNNLNGLSVNNLVQRFAGVQQQDAESSRAESYGKEYTRNTDYEIVRIPDFETASEYGDYTSWCVTHNKNMYDSYTSNGAGLFYFCLRNGFKNEQPNIGEGCPLDEYGLSMIAVSVTMDGELNTCTCRWNHDNDGNDNIMDKNQIEELLGVNFYEVFKPYTREELHKKGVILFDEVQGLLDSGKKPEEILDDVYEFHEGVACVELHDKWNYINDENQILSPNQWFDDVYNFSEGFGTIMLNEKFNYINKEGQILSPNQWFEWCGNFSEGLGAIRLNDKFNYINREGQMLSQNQWFEWCDDFNEGFGRIKLKGKYYYINKEGVLFDYLTKEPLLNQTLNENLKKDIVNNLKRELIKVRKEVNTKPTEAQIKAENYKMGHIKMMGFDITIENPKNSYRQGVDSNGKKWKTKMYYDYGYFKHTLGKDGDAIDVFIGDNLKSDKIFVVDQFLSGKFDESKVMLGFNTEKEAKEGYLKNYEKDWKGFKKITGVSIDVFKEWLYDGYKQRKPFYQYAEIKRQKLNENKQTSTKDVFDKIEKYLNFKNNSNLKLCKVQRIRDKYSDEVYYIAEIYGGLNGNGEWVKYLEDIKYILSKIKDSWVIDLSCDCADDVWTLKVGFQYPKTLNEGCWGYEWYDSDQALDECSVFAEKILSWLCDSIIKKMNKKEGVHTDYIYGYLGMIRELLNTEEIFIEKLYDNDTWFELRDLVEKGYKYCIEHKDTYREPKKFDKKITKLKKEIDKLLKNKYTRNSKHKINEKVEYRLTLNEIKNRKNEEGKEVPQKCEECGSDVVLKIKGEPIFICSNEKCKKYYGVLPFSRNK